MKQPSKIFIAVRFNSKKRLISIFWSLTSYYILIALVIAAFNMSDLEKFLFLHKNDPIFRQFLLPLILSAIFAIPACCYTLITASLQRIMLRDNELSVPKGNILSKTKKISIADLKAIELVALPDSDTFVPKFHIGFVSKEYGLLSYPYFEYRFDDQLRLTDYLQKKGIPVADDVRKLLRGEGISFIEGRRQYRQMSR